MACMKLKPGSPLWRMYAQEHIEAERVHAGQLELDPVLPEKVLPPSGAMPAVDTVMHANLLSKRKEKGGTVTSKKATLTTQKKTVSEPNEEVTAKKAKVTTKKQEGFRTE